MDGRERQRGYIIGSKRHDGRIIVPPSHTHQSSVTNYIIPTGQPQQAPRIHANGNQHVVQSSPTQVAQTTSPGAPYNQRHQPTSNPTINLADNSTISFTSDGRRQTTSAQPAPAEQPGVTGAASSSPQLTPATGTINKSAGANIQPSAQQSAASATNSAALTEAQRRYHQAWQNYYQKYYENYYIAALQEQQARFAKQQAEVVDSREPDGKLSQSEVQQRLTDDIISKAKSATKRARQHWWFWPIIVAIITIVIFLLLQYNSVIAAKIASFVSPGSSSTQTIIVGTGSNQPVSDSPRIIIPKINVNAPVTYGLTDLSETAVQTALQNGPINYPVAGATALPGQRGNTVILGHSSADFFAPGDYKFIFVQLNRLTPGDLFYLDYGTTRYTYKVRELKSIAPTDIAALNLGDDKPYATLVTCDPPGTIQRRLLVIADQVSPNPNNATEVQSTEPAKNSPSTITGKPKTLLENIFGS